LGRAAELVERLHEASEALIGLVEGIAVDRWAEVARPGEWAPGKDAEHVAEGNALHLWFVRAALGQRIGRRPVIHRTRLTAELIQVEVITQLKQRAEESGRVILSLSEEELALPCRGRSLGEFIERVLIGHYLRHQAAIERKLLRRPQA
jgi:DinB family protein